MSSGPLCFRYLNFAGTATFGGPKSRNCSTGARNHEALPPSTRSMPRKRNQEPLSELGDLRGKVCQPRSILGTFPQYLKNSLFIRFEGRIYSSQFRLRVSADQASATGERLHG